YTQGMPNRALAGTAWSSPNDELLPVVGLALGLVAAGWAGAAGRAPASAELTDWVPAVPVAGGSSLAGRWFSWAATANSWAVTVLPPKVSRPAGSAVTV